MPVATSTCRSEGAAQKMLCQQFPLAGWPGHEQLWVAFLAVFLELPDGMYIYHAGPNDNLELRSLQEHSAKCLWQGVLRVKAEPPQFTAEDI